MSRQSYLAHANKHVDEAIEELADVKATRKELVTLAKIYATLLVAQQFIDKARLQ